MGGKVTVRNFETIIRNLNEIPVHEKERLQVAMEAAGTLLYEAVMRKAELVDEHDLNALSHYHVYTNEAGQTKYIGAYSTKLGPDGGPHPDELVHIQSGNLYRSIEKLIRLQDDKAIVAVGVSRDKVPYIEWLIDGTAKMRPRDFLGHAWLDVRAQVLQIIKNGLTPGRTSRRGIV